MLSAFLLQSIKEFNEAFSFIDSLWQKSKMLTAFVILGINVSDDISKCLSKMELCCKVSHTVLHIKTDLLSLYLVTLKETNH